MLKFDTNTDKIIPWKIDKRNSFIEFLDEEYSIDLSLLLDEKQVKNINNIKLDVYQGLSNKKDSITAEKTKKQSKVYRLLQTRITKNSENIGELILLSKILNIREGINKNSANKSEIKNKKIVEAGAIDYNKIQLLNRAGILKNKKEKTFFVDEEFDSQIRVKFNIKKENVIDNVIYVKIAEFSNYLSESSNTKFGSYIIALNCSELKNNSRFIFEKPVVNHFIDKKNGLIKFEIKNLDKNADKVRVFYKYKNKYSVNESEIKEIYSSELNYKNILNFKYPYLNKDCIFRFVLTNNFGYDSEYAEINLTSRNTINNNSYAVNISNTGKSFNILISSIPENTYSFLCERKQVFPKSLIEHKTQFIIQNFDLKDSVDYEDDFDLLDGYIYEYKITAINKNGTSNNFNKSEVLEFKKIEQVVTNTTLENTSFNINGGKLKTKFDIKIDTKNIKNVATDLSFNSSNTVKNNGEVVTGSVGLSSKTDIFDPRIKNILLPQEYDNHFTYETSVRNKKTGLIVNLGKNFSNFLDSTFDISQTGKRGNYEYIVETKSRHKSVFDSNSYKFFHPYVRKFGTIVPKNVNDVKIVKDDFLIGELHEIKVVDIVNEETTDEINQGFAGIDKGVIYFIWDLKNPNMNIDRFEIILDEGIVAKILAETDKTSFSFYKKVYEKDFGEYNYSLIGYNDDNKKILEFPFNKITV